MKVDVALFLYCFCIHAQMSQTTRRIFSSLFILFAITVKEQILQPCYIAGRKSNIKVLEQLLRNYFKSVDFNISDDSSDELIGTKNLDKIGPIREIWFNRFLSPVVDSFRKIPFSDQLPGSASFVTCKELSQD